MLDTLAPGEYSRTKKLIDGTESEKYGRRSLCVLKNQTELRPIRFDIKYRVIFFFRTFDRFEPSLISHARVAARYDSLSIFKIIAIRRIARCPSMYRMVKINLNHQILQLEIKFESS